MRVDWSAGETGSIYWNVSSVSPLLRNAESFNFRIANVFDIDGATCTTTTPPDTGDVEFTIRFHLAGGAEEDHFSNEYGLIPPPDYFFVKDANDPDSDTCRPSTFRQTMRAPVNYDCPAFDPAEIVGVSFHFGGGFGDAEGSVLIDSLEFIETESGGPACPE